MTHRFDGPLIWWVQLCVTGWQTTQGWCMHGRKPCEDENSDILLSVGNMSQSPHTVKTRYKRMDFTGPEDVSLWWEGFCDQCLKSAAKGRCRDVPDTKSPRKPNRGNSLCGTFLTNYLVVTISHLLFITSLILISIILLFTNESHVIKSKASLTWNTLSPHRQCSIRWLCLVCRLCVRTFI